MERLGLQLAPPSEVREAYARVRSRSEAHWAGMSRPLARFSRRHRLALVRLLGLLQLATNISLLVQGMLMQSILMEGCALWVEAWWTLCSGILGVVGSLVCLAGTALRSQKGLWASPTALAVYTPAILLAFLATARTIIYSGAVEASCLNHLEPTRDCDRNSAAWGVAQSLNCGQLCLVPGHPEPYYLRSPAVYQLLLAQPLPPTAPTLNVSDAYVVVNGSLSTRELSPSSLASFCTRPRYWAHILLLLVASIAFMCSALLLCRQWNPGPETRRRAESTISRREGRHNVSRYGGSAQTSAASVTQF